MYMVPVCNIVYAYALSWVLLIVHRQPIDNLTPEERDARTVFCMQLAARIRPRDLEDFFSAVGKVGHLSIMIPGLHLNSIQVDL